VQTADNYDVLFVQSWIWSGADCSLACRARWCTGCAVHICQFWFFDSAVRIFKISNRIK